MKEILLFSFLCTLWSTTWLVAKLGLNGMPPIAAAAVRFLFAALILGGVLAFRRKLVFPTRDALPTILSAGVLGIGIHYALIYWGISQLASGSVAALSATMPLFVGLFERLRSTQEAASGSFFLGTAISLMGLFFLYVPAGAGFSPLGTIAVLVATAVGALNMIIARSNRKNFEVDQMNFYSQVIGGTILLGLSLLFESDRVVVLNFQSVGALLYLTVLGTVGAFSAFYTLLRSWPASRVSIAFLVYPVGAVFFGAAVMGEPLGPETWAGAAAVLLGFLVTRSGEAFGRRIRRLAVGTACVFLFAVVGV